MADKSTQLILEALSRAAAEPGGAPLLGSKTAPGLFAATPAARLLAERCKDDGYLRVVRTEARGKAEQEICALTDKGLAYLLNQRSPRTVLEDLVRALEARQTQVDALLSAVNRWRDDTATLTHIAGQALRHLHPTANGNPGPTRPAWTEAALDHLARRQDARGADDCPLPELFRVARQAAHALTIGQFHDGLRDLYDQGRVYLHPWTGPLYDLPEPPFALLVGHEVAYYASPRNIADCRLQIAN